MNRRGFIKSILAPVVASVIPITLTAQSVTSYLPTQHETIYYDIPVCTDWNMPLNTIQFVDYDVMMQ